MNNLLLRLVTFVDIYLEDVVECCHLTGTVPRLIPTMDGRTDGRVSRAPGLTGHANWKPERARGSPEIYKRGEDLRSAAEVWRTHERFSFLVALIRDRRAALDWHYARVGADPLWQKALGVMRGNGRGPGPYLWGRRDTCNRPCAALAGLTCVPASFWCRVDPVSSISTEIFPTASVLSWHFTFEFTRIAKSETTSCIFGCVKKLTNGLFTLTE